MPTSTADVATDRPGRYGKQLVSHLTRRAQGAWDDEGGTGWLDFGELGNGTLRVSAASLELVVGGTDLDRLEDVVGRHLVRFGARDELVVVWTRDDGTPGTEHRHTGDA